MTLYIIRHGELLWPGTSYSSAKVFEFTNYSKYRKVLDHIFPLNHFEKRKIFVDLNPLDFVWNSQHSPAQISHHILPLTSCFEATILKIEKLKYINWFQSINQSINQSIKQAINQSINQSIHS